MGQRARYSNTHKQRTHTRDTAAIDHPTLHKAIKKLSPSDRSILCYIASGAAWTQGNIHHLDNRVASTCKLCGQAEPDITHGIWQCPVVLNKAKSIRAQQQLAWVPNDMIAGNTTTHCPKQAAGPLGAGGAAMGADTNHTSTQPPNTDRPTRAAGPPGDRWR